MVPITGGFGPFRAAQLTELLEDVAVHSGQHLQHAVLHDVQYRAGHYYAITEVRAELPDGPVDQSYYGITTAPVPPGAVGHHATIGQTSVFVWRHPADPLLPGLGLAATPAHVRRHFAPNRDLTQIGRAHV